jgi:hypothetical protein
MNQALYAHMNNKRKMEEKKKSSVALILKGMKLNAKKMKNVSGYVLQLQNIGS